MVVTYRPEAALRGAHQTTPKIESVPPWVTSLGQEAVDLAVMGWYAA